MGPYQQGDPAKSIPGFVSLINALQSQTSQPIFATEFGQYCCASEGACYLYDGTYNGMQIGYVHALLEIYKERGIHWMAWGW